MSEQAKKIIVKLSQLSSVTISKDSKFAKSLKLFDIGNLFLGIINLVKFYQYLLKEEPSIKQLEISIKAKKISNHVPFADVEVWLNYVNKFGLPITKKDSTVINKKNDRGILFECNYDSKLAITISGLIGVDFGLPIDITPTIIAESIRKTSTS